MKISSLLFHSLPLFTAVHAQDLLTTLQSSGLLNGTLSTVLNLDGSFKWTGNSVTYNGQKYSCKCYVDAPCWPKPLVWAALNLTVGGRLQQALPPAVSCHNTFEGKPTYNAAKCAEVNANYTNEQWTTDQTVAELWPFWTNQTCLPTTNPSDSCTRGFYPNYVIMSTKKEHIKAGIDFARLFNIRLIIRNTGHDFLGRSTGFGSLAINTHSFKDVAFTTSYAGPGSYKGGAVTLGAGIQTRELYRLARKQNPPVIVVGGECPTVGIAGGYIQGGGHGPMATLHGMAADNALSFDVITADGRYVTANEATNPDLFWALKGGGPSTFGALVSVTLKTHADPPSAGVVVDINSTHTTDLSLIWKAASEFHSRANLWTDNGMFVYYELFPGSLHIRPFVMPNADAAKIANVTQPFFDALDANKIPYTKLVKDYPTFFDLYTDLFEDEVAGGATIVGGRIFTRDDIKNHNDEIMAAYQKIVAPDPGSFMNYGFVIGHVVGPGVGMPSADNAINPVWRNASSFSITNVVVPDNATWADKQAAQKYLTYTVDEMLRKASPGGAAYVNEGDLEEPNWQYTFWGDRYFRLLSIRKTWDPYGVFYTRTTPGTEDWSVIDYNTKLCKKT